MFGDTISNWLIALITTGVATLLFFIVYIISFGMWHDFRRINSAPKWYTFRLLVAIKVLRIRKPHEVIHKRIFAEIMMTAISYAYVFLGTINFVAGIIFLDFLGALRDETCSSAEEMGSKCKIPDCQMGCGGLDFNSCGRLTCNATRCAANLPAFLQAAGDSLSTAAASHFNSLQQQLAVVQSIASMFGTLSSMLVLAIPTMLAGYRADKSALNATSYLSLVCMPIYYCFASMIFWYGWPLREPCTYRSSELDGACSMGLSAIYWAHTCRMGYASMDRCTSALVLSVSALLAEGTIGIVAAYVASRYRVSYYLNAVYRRNLDAAAATDPPAAAVPDEPAGPGIRRLGARLVTEDDYTRLPGLLQLYRGHGGAVLCAKIAPLPAGGDAAGEEPERLITGSMDGSVRVWDVVEGTCLSVWKADRPVQALCVFRVKGPGRAQHRQPTVAAVNGRALWPEASGAKFGDALRPEDAVLWVRVFRARPDPARQRKPPTGGGGRVAGAAEGGPEKEGVGGDGEGDSDRDWEVSELVGGCFFTLREAMRVTTRCVCVCVCSRGRACV